jgi:hypothetical protein
VIGTTFMMVSPNIFRISKGSVVIAASRYSKAKSYRGMLKEQ